MAEEFLEESLSEAPDEAGQTGALSVSQAMALAKGALEGISVTLLGEVSEVNDKPGYKAVYFTIKDERASLPCMMWVNRYHASGIKLEVGQLVEIAGRFSLFPAKGRMNFDVFSITLAGEGRLRLQVAQLAKQLEADGLMDPARKKPLPAYPEVIGLVTSPRGDAVHDVLRTLRRRYPLAKVLLAGVPVEGDTAPAALVDGLAAVVFGGAEVVLLVRGGGSYENLMPFNNPRLALTISRCYVPVITGIGHEPDTTIADMVADVRASTPTAAAERVAPSHDEILLHLEGLKTRLVNAQRRRLDTAALRVNQLAALPPLREPQRLFENEALALDDLAMRLSRALPASLERDTHHLNRLHDALAHSLPRLLMLPQSRVSAAQHRLGLLGPTLSVPFKHRTQQLVERLQRAADSGFEPYEARLSLQASRLHDLSPLTVLARGYSITRTEDGALVSSIERVNEGDKLNIAVSDGTVSATVDSTHVRKVSL